MIIIENKRYYQNEIFIDEIFYVYIYVFVLMIIQ